MRDIKTWIEAQNAQYKKFVPPSSLPPFRNSPLPLSPLRLVFRASIKESIVQNFDRSRRASFVLSTDHERRWDSRPTKHSAMTNLYQSTPASIVLSTNHKYRRPKFRPINKNAVQKTFDRSRAIHDFDQSRSPAKVLTNHNDRHSCFRPITSAGQSFDPQSENHGYNLPSIPN